MKPAGWNSKQTLFEAIEELEHFNLIIKTRQGGRHKPSLYGFTWWAIDDCGGKLDFKPTAGPLRGWQEPRAPFQAKRKLKAVSRPTHTPGSQAAQSATMAPSFP
jgi:hypothetical protein